VGYGPIGDRAGRAPRAHQEASDEQRDAPRLEFFALSAYSPLSSPVRPVLPVSNHGDKPAESAAIRENESN